MADGVNIKWYLLPFKLRRVESSIAPGFLLCTIALVVRTLHSTFIIQYSDSDVDPILNYESTIWYIGACMGSLFCGFKRHIWSIRLTNFIIGCILLAALGGYQLLFAKYFQLFRNKVVLDAGFFLNLICGISGGFSYAFIYIILLCYIADNVSKNYRGFLITSIAMIDITAPFFMFGYLSMFLVVAISIAIIVVLIAIVWTWFFTYESVTSSLKPDNMEESVRIYSDSHSKALGPVDIHNEIDEKLKMMEDEHNESDNCFVGIVRNGNWKPILWISALRLAGLLALIQASMLTPATFFIYSILLGRLVSLIISKFTLDFIGRKWLFWLSCISCFIGMAITTGYYFGEDFMGRETYRIVVFVWFMLLSLGMEPVKHLYTCEVFPISKRNASIAFVTIVEHCGAIIFSLLWNNYSGHHEKYFLIGGNVILVVLILSLFKLPETKRKSLLECQRSFNNYYERYDIIPSAPEA